MKLNTEQEASQPPQDEGEVLVTKMGLCLLSCGQYGTVGIHMIKQCAFNNTGHQEIQFTLSGNLPTPTQ